MNTARDSAPKVESGTKTLAAPGSQTCLSGMPVLSLYQLSYIPTHHALCLSLELANEFRGEF